MTNSPLPIQARITKLIISFEILLLNTCGSSHQNENSEKGERCEQCLIDDNHRANIYISTWILSYATYRQHPFGQCTKIKKSFE